MATIFGTGYSRGDLNYTADGSAIATARKDSNGYPYFKLSSDGGVTWPADGSAVLIEAVDIGSRGAQVHQKPGKSTLVAYVARTDADPTDRIWESENYGRTWGAV